jgi:ABC-type branched-subunit amino acid transport system substrate-binding protein
MVRERGAARRGFAEIHMNPPRQLNASRRPAWPWIAASLSPLLLLLHAGTTPDHHLQPADPAPFLNHRESTLAYYGPSTDFTNLTQLRIGWFGPTNLNDPLTGDLWWAANRAVDEANASLPISGLKSHRSAPPHLSSSPSDSLLRFRLIPSWSIDPWGTGVSQLTRMVYAEEPLAVLGSVDSASTHLAEQIVAKANLPLVSPLATDPSVTLAGVAWTFACAPTDGAVARILVDGILACPILTDPAGPPNTAPRLVLVTATDHESRMTAREVLREFCRRQRPPDFRLEFSNRPEGLDHLLATLTEIEPEVILMVSGAEDAARLVRAIRDHTSSHVNALSSTVIFGSQAMGRARFLELAGPAAEGVRFPLLAVPPSPDDPGAMGFLKAFTTARGHAPDYAAILTYDATRLLLAAIRNAGPNRDRIRSALAALSPWAGLAGTIHFDGTGQNTRTNMPMAMIRQERLEWSRDLESPPPWTDSLCGSDLEAGSKRGRPGLPRRSRAPRRLTRLSSRRNLADQR